MGLLDIRDGTTKVVSGGELRDEDSMSLGGGTSEIAVLYTISCACIVVCDS
jgi:hypothetical protein